MESYLPFIFGLVAIILALLFKPVADKLRIPYAIILVVLGYFGSELIISQGFETGIRADNFQLIIHNILIPILIFNAAFHIKLSMLRAEVVPIAILTIPVLIITLLLTAVLIFISIYYPSGFPWMAGLITAAILLPTGSRAAAEFLRQYHAHPRIILLLEVESLVASVIAIVSYSLFIMIALEGFTTHSLWMWFAKFFWLCVIGIISGLSLAYITINLFKLSNKNSINGIISIVMAYLCYLSTEYLFPSSGAVALFCFPIFISSKPKATLSDKNLNFIKEFWELNASLATIIIYLLMGVTLSLPMFTERWLAILIAIVSIFIARSLGIHSFFALFKLNKSVERIDFNQQSILNWCGVRGDLALALALSLPTSLNYWWTIQSIAFGVMLFTLFIQAPMTAILLKEEKA